MRSFYYLAMLGALAACDSDLDAPQGFVLEDQADTLGFSLGFVSGYIHDAPAPVCGETRVFHLVSRN